MPAYWHAWVSLCNEYKLVFSEQRFYSFAGTPVNDIMAILRDEKTSAWPGDRSLSVEELCQAKKEFSKQSVAVVGTPAIDAVIDIVKRYHGKVPMAVASSGYRENVMHSLKSNNILQYFDAVVTCEDITHPKPAPDIFLEAARRIGCDPAFCRGFEDAETGMLSLVAAGMEAIDVRLMDGYPHPLPSDTLVGI